MSLLLIIFPVDSDFLNSDDEIHWPGLRNICSHTNLETKGSDLRPLPNLKLCDHHSKYEMLFP
jgi:hypothetical protein